MLRWITIMLTALSSGHLMAQQHALYSQYVFNLYMINPAYAGSRDALSANAGYRTQWLGVDGAPTTQNFSLHGPLKARNMAMGIQFQNDEIGARKAPMASVSYTYSLFINRKERINLAVASGIMNYHINWDALNYNERNDPVTFAAVPSTWLPTFDFGAMYIAPKGYAGLSITGLNRNRLNLSPLSDARLQSFYNLVFGKIHKLQNNTIIKTSGLVRYTDGAPIQFDVSTGMLLANKLWITTGYRYNFGMILSAHMYVNDRLHLGYAYDYALNNLAIYQNGTHEIFLGYDFNIYHQRKRSPKYF